MPNLTKWVFERFPKYIIEKEEKEERKRERENNQMTARTISTQPTVLYCITNMQNGRRYFGITSDPINERMTAHFNAANIKSDNSPIHIAMAEFPRNVWDVEVIASGERSKMQTLENKIIRELLIFAGEDLYNMLAGARNKGKVRSEEVKKRQSEARKGRKMSEAEYILRYGESREHKEVFHISNATRALFQELTAGGTI